MADENIQPQRPDSPIAFDLMPRRFKNYIVSERELHSLGFMSAAGSLFTALFGVAFGAALVLGITLNTVNVPAGKIYTAYWVGFLVSVISAVCFFGLSVMMFIRSFLDVRTIKRESEQRQRELLG